MFGTAGRLSEFYFDSLNPEHLITDSLNPGKKDYLESSFCVKSFKFYYVSFNIEHLPVLLSMSRRLKGEPGQGLGLSNYVTKLFCRIGGY